MESIVNDWGTHFLRDDQNLGLCDYERYSLFHRVPYYGRSIVLAGPLEWAMQEAIRIVYNEGWLNQINDTEPFGILAVQEVRL